MGFLTPRMFTNVPVQAAEVGCLNRTKRTLKKDGRTQQNPTFKGRTGGDGGVIAARWACV